MAVTGAGPPPSSVRPFVRLKLRLLANSMRGSAQRVIGVVFGLTAGCAIAVAGFAGFAAGSSAPSDPAVRFVAVTALGTLVTLGWTLLPLLFFGVDETLDPARFALLPLPRPVLTRGLLAAACVGIPPVMTLVATLGLVVGAASRGGPAAVPVALLASAVGLLGCVTASRAVTSAFAGALRSRRMRDLAAVILTVVASSVAPLQAAVGMVLRRSDVDRILTIAQVLAWTPLAAPYAAVVDASEGRWGLAAARLAVGAATVPVLLWWWSRTIGTAMVGAVSAGPAGRRDAAPGTAVAALFPGLLRRARVPASRFWAIVARELRYWLREPRRRASLASLVISSAVVPLMLRLPSLTASGGGQSGQRDVGAPLPVVVCFSGVVIAVVLVNQFGMDGTAYAMHLLTGVPGRVELLARGTALALFGLPLLVVVTAVVGAVSHATAAVPAGIGTASAALGTSLGVASVMSVAVPYPMPDSTNPFAMGSGSGSVKSMLSLGALFASAACNAPVLIAYALLPASASALLAPVGVAWGLSGALAGAYLAGRMLDRRAPEVLLAITPRR